jgi:hypothetical protein
MLQKFLGLIRGVTLSNLDAAISPNRPSRRSEPSQYAPRSAIHAAAITAVGPSGECFEPWRINATTGEQWYRRISNVDGRRPIRAISAIGYEIADDVAVDPAKVHRITGEYEDISTIDWDAFDRRFDLGKSLPIREATNHDDADAEGDSDE